MTNENIKLVQDTYAAFGKGDIPTMLANMTDDVQIGIVGRKEDAPFFGMFDGKDGVGQFLAALGGAHEIHEFVPQRFVAGEDMVFVWGGYHWTMRKSGVSKKSNWLHVLTVRDGKIAKWHGHNDTAMLAQAYHAVPVQKESAAQRS